MTNITGQHGAWEKAGPAPLVHRAAHNKPGLAKAGLRPEQEQQLHRVTASPTGDRVLGVGNSTLQERIPGPCVGKKRK